MSKDDDETSVLLDQQRREGDRVIRRKVIAVPKSAKFPEGMKYRLHYGTLDDETLLRYDNSHGIHEKHVGETVERIDYPGIAELLQRFSEEVETK